MEINPEILQEYINEFTKAFREHPIKIIYSDIEYLWSDEETVAFSVTVRGAKTIRVYKVSLYNLLNAETSFNEKIYTMVFPHFPHTVV